MLFPRSLRTFSLGYVAVGLSLIAAVSILLNRSIRYRKVENAKAVMRMTADLVATSIDEHDQGFFDDALPQRLIRFGKHGHLRLTLISLEGEVIADSKTGTVDIGPHENRLEVLMAVEKGTGFAERYSRTLDQEMLYFARCYPSWNNPVGLIRVSQPSDSIDGFISPINAIFWIFSLLAMIATLCAFAVFFARQLTPLNALQKAARDVGAGKFERDPALRRCRGVWSPVAMEFERMKYDTFQRETGLFERGERLEAVLSSMIEGVLAIDSQGSIMLANPAASKMFGLDEQLTNKKLLELVRIPDLREAVEKTQLNRTLSKTEFETLTEPKRRLRARVSVLPSDTQPGVAIVLHDVTELRKLETMRQDFVANVSHELKTPLSSIKAYAETLKLGAIDDEQNNRKFVERIESEAVHLEHQIQDLMELAKVESGEAVFQITDVSINDACRECYYQFEKMAADSQLKLELDLCRDNLMIRADLEAVRTTFSNLIVNAIHYTPAGGSVTIETRLDNLYAVVRITDTGIGIAPDHQDRIFERFYRVDRARSRDKGGTGLGLAIVKHLTQQFGGRTQVQSQIGKGSTFTVSFPLNARISATSL
jgi:two-component system phosphate regulon sensor histidine kinase PhoR